MAATRTTRERTEWLASFAAKLPAHIGNAFLSEAAQHPDEYPTITREINETYPDTRAWRERTRTYEPGISHWEWADGSGFPPREGAR